LNNNQVQTTNNNSPKILGSEFMPQSFEGKLKLAEVLARSGLCPNGMNTREKVYVALQMGHELGLSPMIAVQNIHVINGKPATSTGVMKGIAFNTGLLETYKEEELLNPDGTIFGVHVTGKRKDNGFSFEGKFTLDDAKRAGLLGKDNWKYPAVMLNYRANSIFLKKAFPELLAGLLTPEEAENIPHTRDVTNSATEGEKLLTDVKESLTKEIDENKGIVIVDDEPEKKEEKKPVKDVKKQAVKTPKKEKSDNLIKETKKEQTQQGLFGSDDKKDSSQDAIIVTENDIIKLLTRAGQFKKEMNENNADHFNEFKSLSMRMSDKSLNYEDYSKNHYMRHLDLVEDYEKKAGKK
jgi:hypothetical protein